MTYYGDFEFGSTVYLRFTTVNSTGAPTAFSSGGITVYRNGSTVADTTGITLTSTFAGRTGLNLVTIGMSTAGFYSSAGSYVAVISSGAASEDLSGYVVGEWSVRRSPTITVSTTAAITSVTSVTGNVTGSVGSVASATGLATAIWGATRASYTAAGSFGQVVSTSTADPSIWANSAAGSASSDIAAKVWNATRSNFTAAGSFGQLVSTSTAAPRIYVSGSTLVTSQFSTVGLETLSTVGLETLSTVGLETVSSAVIAASVWSATRSSYTAAGSFGQIVSTSTAAPVIYAGSSIVTSQFSTAGLETGSSNVNVVEIAGDSTSADKLKLAVDSNVRGTANAGSSSTGIVLSAIDPAIISADQYKGMVVVFDSDTNTANLRSQRTDILSNSTLALEVTALTVAPSSLDTFTIV